MNILYLTHPLNGLFMIVIPIAVGIYMVHRFKLGWGLWWAGCLTFILSQVVHIPFNLILLSPFIGDSGNLVPGGLPTLFFTSMLLGLSAGVFEETARYGVYRWWQKDARSWSKALLFGSGHGGIEAILLGLIVLYTFLQMVTLRGTDLLSIVPENYVITVQQQIDVYWSVPWHLSLMGAVERAFTIPFHMSAAVIVLQSFKRLQIRWLFLAILWHALVDALVLSSAQLWGIFAAEGLLGLVAILSVVIMLAFREHLYENEEVLPPLKGQLSIDKLTTSVVSAEKLEETRYDHRLGDHK